MDELLQVDGGAQRGGPPTRPEVAKMGRLRRPCLAQFSVWRCQPRRHISKLHELIYTKINCENTYSGPSVFRVTGWTNSTRRRCEEISSPPHRTAGGSRRLSRSRAVCTRPGSSARRGRDSSSAAAPSRQTPAARSGCRAPATACVPLLGLGGLRGAP